MSQAAASLTVEWKKFKVTTVCLAHTTIQTCRYRYIIIAYRSWYPSNCYICPKWRVPNSITSFICTTAVTTGSSHTPWHLLPKYYQGCPTGCPQVSCPAASFIAFNTMAAGGSKLPAVCSLLACGHTVHDPQPLRRWTALYYESITKIPCPNEPPWSARA